MPLPCSHCHNLQGLNILGMLATELENQIQLWEILSGLKLHDTPHS